MATKSSKPTQRPVGTAGDGSSKLDVVPRAAPEKAKPVPTRSVDAASQSQKPFSSVASKPIKAGV